MDHGRNPALLAAFAGWIWTWTPTAVIKKLEGMALLCISLMVQGRRKVSVDRKGSFLNNILNEGQMGA
jgi:hypothetical protein